MNPRGHRRDSRAEVARARRSYLLRRNATAWLFLLPALVFFAVFLLVPIAWVVRQSFMEGGIITPARWVGLSNWRDAFQDPVALAAIKHTVVFTALVVPAVFVLALALASLLRSFGRGAAGLRAAVYLPQLIPTAAAAQIWVFMIHPDFGILNVANRSLGKPPINFRGEAQPAFSLIVLFETWRGVAYWSIFLLAAMIAVPKDRYQAAAIDGASTARRFWHVTLPGIRPALAVAVLLSVISALQVFDSVFILTGGGPNGATETTVTYMFRSVFESGQPGIGAVLSLISVVIVIALTALVAFAVWRRGRLIARNGVPE